MTNRWGAWYLCLLTVNLGFDDVYAETGGSVEIQTPYANDLGSGWFYYIAHSGNDSYVSDYRQHCIRQYDSQAGFRNAHKRRAKFDQPHGICINGRGEVVVADTGNHCIRAISPQGLVSTLAGKCGHPGDMDGSPEEALFSDVLDVQCLSNCSVLVTEPGAGRIRLIKDTSDTCPAAGSSGRDGRLPWHWLSHWYVLAGVVAVGLVAAVSFYDARLAGLQALLSSYLARPSAAEANTADNTDAEQQASLARLTMARIFSLRRTETMRRTQSDSLAANHTYRSISQRRADRAVQATRDAAAILQVKQKSQSSSGQTGQSPNRQPGQSPHEHDMSDSHGHSSQNPHGHDNSGLQTARPQHELSEELSTAQQRADPNTDVFQLFDSSMSPPRGSGQQDRSGMFAGAFR